MVRPSVHTISRRILLQSHRSPLPHPWLSRCLESARGWAAYYDFDYRFIGDELYSGLPPILRRRFTNQPVVAADLGRILAIQSALNEGYDQVVWMDADFLVIAPERLCLPPSSYALGREIWIEARGNRLRAFRKVHNAFLMFCRGNPFLDFYAHAARRVLERHSGKPIAQLIGPKLLTAVHNIIECPVVESAGCLSPAVLRDVASGGGSALTKLFNEGGGDLAGANLCASSVVAGEISDEQMMELVKRLVASGSLRS